MSESIPVLKERPSPEQMFALAGLYIQLGKLENNALRSLTLSRDGNSPVKAVAFSSDFLTPPDQAFYDFIFDNPVSVSRKIVGRIRRSREEAWKMQVKETCSVFKGGDRIDEAHIGYRFKWTESKVLEACRRVTFVDLEKDYGESYQQIYLDQWAFAADFMGGVNQFHALGLEDCKQHMADIIAFTSALEQLSSS